MLHRDGAASQGGALARTPTPPSSVPPSPAAGSSAARAAFTSSDLPYSQHIRQQAAAAQSQLAHSAPQQPLPRLPPRRAPLPDGAPRLNQFPRGGLCKP